MLKSLWNITRWNDDRHGLSCEWVLNDDLTTKVLSHLPIESVPSTISVSKLWYNLTMCQSFRHAHFTNNLRKNILSGVFVQGVYYCTNSNCCQDYLDTEFVDFLSLNAKEGKHKVKKSILDFLPEKVVINSSCNGLLVCRSLFRRLRTHNYSTRTNNPDPAELVIYVCNPLTKEFHAISPNLTNSDRCGVALAFRDSSSICYEVVVVQLIQESKASFCYTFKIYSSKTDSWRVPNEISSCPHRLQFHKQVYVNGMFHWLTDGHSMLTFDLKNERALIVMLPSPVMGLRGEWAICLGESEGYLHYVFCSRNAFHVWILKGSDYSNPRWELKHLRHVVDRTKLVDSENWDGTKCHLPDSNNMPNFNIEPLAFKDNVVFTKGNLTLRTYNIKTGQTDEITSFGKFHYESHRTPFILPYSRSLLPVRNTVGSSLCLK
ncbi:hypothetical protein FRX31_018386 [Thalictrum thalictroides]|uniref:F-box associated beta-propeller type 1 domain-containing protein n=1 Tax=Thalictrum thalictroides TaxID=46969 RepID=A0A7J6W4Z5_THATH|nr:hypothetical protein FRX31_018386 [Thalictrum thalictroides]